MQTLASDAAVGLEGRAAWGAEGLAQMMPGVAQKVAHTALWAKEGLEMGDVHATARGVRAQLAEVRDTVGLLHQANDTLERIGLRRQQVFATHADTVERLRNIAKLSELATAYMRREPHATPRCRAPAKPRHARGVRTRALRHRVDRPFIASALTFPPPSS